MALLALVIPCYASRAYIEANLSSVLKALESAPTDVEVIYTVDPKEGDDTLSFLEERLKGDARFRIYGNQRALGPGANRLSGVLRSTADYVAFLDSDDLLEADFFSKICPEAGKKLYDVLGYSNYYLKDGKKRKATYRPSFECDGLEYLSKVFGDISVRGFLWTKVIRRELLLADDMPILGFNEDTAVLSTVLPKAARVLQISDPLVDYRKGNPDSITESQKKDRYPKAATAFASIRAYYEIHGMEEEEGIFLAHRHRSRSSLTYARGLSKKAGLSKEELAKDDSLVEATFQKEPLLQAAPWFKDIYLKLPTLGRLREELGL